MNLFLYYLVACILAYGSAEETEFSDPSSESLPEELSKTLIQSSWSVFGTGSSRWRPSAFVTTPQYVELDTALGKIRGVQTRTNKGGIVYDAYYGIPYAKPPVDGLRFMAPESPEPWEGVYDATYERAACMQFLGTGIESEDCLYVNVYVPERKNEDPLPVMVFIHGGAFVTGSSNSSTYSPDFIIKKDVILVTFNYRLGVLGFLSFQNDEIPGNVGLKDQALALKWVRDNIADYGGDENRITIFGESAGSASVHYHLLSPKTPQGLFHRAILESGTANTPWAFIDPDDAAALARKLANKWECSFPSFNEVISCLRAVPARTLTDNQQDLLSLKDWLSFRPVAFAPTVEPETDGAFLPKHPLVLMREKGHESIPVIIGANSREGLVTVPALKKLSHWVMRTVLYVVKKNTSIFIPPVYRNLLGVKENHMVTSALNKRYFSPSDHNDRERLIDLISDTVFILPITHASLLLANSSRSVYNYLFAYEGGYGFFKDMMDLEDERGVCHGDELGYLFHQDMVHDAYGASSRPSYLRDEDMIDRLTQFWTDFAKTGDPTPGPSGPWKTFNASSFNTMYIGTQITLKEGYFFDIMNFWYNVMREAKIDIFRELSEQ